MKIKSFVSVGIFGVFLVIFSVQSYSDGAMRSKKTKPQDEEIPHITNEAEYAEFVKKQEAPGVASSVKTIQSKKSSASSGMSSSRAKLETH